MTVNEVGTPTVRRAGAPTVSNVGTPTVNNVSTQLVSKVGAPTINIVSTPTVINGNPAVGTVDDLKRLAERAAVELAEASAEDVLAWTARTFGRWIVASNFQDAVLIDLASKAQPGVPVLFLETGYHFAETIGTRDAVQTVYPVQIINALPDQTVAEQDATEGPRLFEREPDRCCQLRKVVPLRRTLAGYDAWVTGVRRVDAPTRANTPIVGWDEPNALVKINPLAAWTDDDVDRYIGEHNVLVNPLVGAGYPSIGCAPCTAKPLPGADPRSGRWAGRAKTECGLHG